MDSGIGGEEQSSEGRPLSDLTDHLSFPSPFLSYMLFPLLSIIKRIYIGIFASPYPTPTSTWLGSKVANRKETVGHPPHSESLKPSRSRFGFVFLHLQHRHARSSSPVAQQHCSTTSGHTRQQDGAERMLLVFVVLAQISATLAIAQLQYDISLNVTANTGLSDSCTTTLDGLESHPIGACLNFYGLLNVFDAEDPSASIIGAVEDWIEGACSTTCHPSVVASAAADITANCRRDIDRE